MASPGSSCCVLMNSLKPDTVDSLQLSMEPERSRMIAMRVKLFLHFSSSAFTSFLDGLDFGGRSQPCRPRLLHFERRGDALSRRPPSVVDVAQVLRRNPELGRELLGGLLSLLLLQELHELIEIHFPYGHSSSIRQLTYPSSDVDLTAPSRPLANVLKNLKPASLSGDAGQT